MPWFMLISAPSVSSQPKTCQATTPVPPKPKRLDNPTPTRARESSAAASFAGGCDAIMSHQPDGRDSRSLFGKARSPSGTAVCHKVSCCGARAHFATKYKVRAARFTQATPRHRVALSESQPAAQRREFSGRYPCFSRTIPQRNPRAITSCGQDGPCMGNRV
jgi:hypothetical protein